MKIPVSCPLDCGGCPLLAHVRQGKILRIASNAKGGPSLKGCIKGFRAAETAQAPDRLLTPLIRTGPRGSGQFKETNWKEALTRVADGLLEIKKRHGAQAVLNLGGSGSWRAALHNTALLSRRFFAFFGGATGTFGSYSSRAFRFTAPLVLGTSLAGSDPETIEEARLILLWGANPAEARMGPEWMYRLRKARRKGSAIVVIDPRRTQTVKRLDAEWLPIRPGTDAALMLALLAVLLREDLLDHACFTRCSSGFSALKDQVLGRNEQPAATPEWAADLCGLPVPAIEDLGRRLGRMKPAALIPGLSIQRTLGGEETVRLAIALQTVTGNIGIAGGWAGVYPYGTQNSPFMARIPVPPDPKGFVLPVYRWPNAVLQGRGGGFPSDLKAIYNLGSNYLNQGADVGLNIRAFESVELAVCHDLFLTPTARYCDVIFPVAHFLERSDMVSPAGGNYLLYSEKAIPPKNDLPSDYVIFKALAGKMGFGQAFTQGRTEQDWLDVLMEDSETGDLDSFCRNGLFCKETAPRIGLAEFAADPVAAPLSTPSGRIELSSPAQARVGLPLVPEFRGPESSMEYPIQLVTPKILQRVHSQGFNLSWTGRGSPHPLWLHPEDAAALGLEAGQAALVENEIGRVCLPVRLTRDIKPGVACLAEGVWAAFGSLGIERNGSANVLTSTQPTLPSQGSRTHSISVRVRQYKPEDDGWPSFSNPSLKF